MRPEALTDGPTRGRLRALFDWMFRDRQTHRIVIAQWPNLPLLVWIVTALVSRVVHLHARASSIVGAVGIISLALWAVDEIVRGVNPWRRCLGVLVLGGMVVGLSRR